MRIGPQSVSRGFTLVELLVVIGLIALLGAGVGLAFREGNGGTRLRAAEATGATLFQAARAHAVLSGMRTRVIVLEAPADSGRHLRYLGIICEDGKPGLWRALNQGETLPEGVRFWNAKANAGGTMKLEFPRALPQPATTGPTWVFYEFDPQGRLVPASLQTFVVGLPRSDPALGVEPIFDAAAGAIGGFAAFPLGGIAFPENPEDLR